MIVVQVGVAHPYRGGIAHYTASLHQALLQEGHRSLVVSFSRLYPQWLFPGRSQFDQSRRQVQVDGVRVLDSLNPITWRAAARYIARQKPDAVVFQYWHPYFAPAFTSVVSRLNARGIPAVLICHNVTPHEGHLGARFLRGRLLSRVGRFIVHSDSDRRMLEQIRPGARILMAPHPVCRLFDQPELSRELARERLGLPQETRLILFFGHVRPYKGLDILLRSLPQVLEHLEVRLLVAGEFYGSGQPYERLIRNLNLQSHVVVHDRYVPNEEVAAYFRAADLLVLPYLDATQSGIVPMAYLFDLPIVASSVGGLPEAVKHGETGFVVPPGDPTALAEAITQYFEREQPDVFRDRIAGFREQFSWSRIVSGIELLAGGAPATEAPPPEGAA